MTLHQIQEEEEGKWVSSLCVLCLDLFDGCGLVGWIDAVMIHHQRRKR